MAQETKGKLMNLTVFAGTFNPIHIAHLIIAESVRVKLNAEKILFIPSFVPPHREENIASPEHRLNMVKLATESNPYFEVSDIELKLQGTSYSFNTIQELYRQNPEIKDMNELQRPTEKQSSASAFFTPAPQINFIIGADAFNHIETWYKYEELAKLINFIVLARPKSKEVEEIANNLSLKTFSYKFVEAPRIDISSSFIRQRIKENKSIKYLVPNNVEEYIIKNKLYLDT